jgi:N-acetylmuramoyl-L-alanine amidase
VVALTAVRAKCCPDAVRLTIELAREVPYHSERIQGPDRVFVDLRTPAPCRRCDSRCCPIEDGSVRRVRIGAHPDGSTRVVLDLDGAGRHSVYALYNPYRIVVDVETSRRCGAGPSPLSSLTPRVTPAALPPAVARADGAADRHAASTTARGTCSGGGRDRRDIATTGVRSARHRRRSTGLGHAARSAGRQRARRLLAVAATGARHRAHRIDAGHGGHDPGALVKGLSEAELTLDVALRLEKLLLRQPGVEVIQTRRTNAFVPLEERTDLANRSGADIFLSIHANASADRRARGVETYYLNFAPTAEAEALAAARERRIDAADAPAARNRARDRASTTSWTNRAISRGRCRSRSSRRPRRRTSGRAISA